MAASVYATPPPDLSSEDTALSDASNSSQISSTSSHHSKTTKRNIASVLLGGNNGGINVNNITNSQIITGQTTITTTITATSPSRPSSMSSNSPIDSSIDQSKKRRKQTTPIRISGVTNTTAQQSQQQPEQQQQSQNQQEQESTSSINNQEIENISSDKINLNNSINSSTQNLKTDPINRENFIIPIADNQQTELQKASQQQNNENQCKTDDIKCQSTNETLNKNSKENCDKSKDEIDESFTEVKDKTIKIEPTIDTITTNLKNISKNETDLNSKSMKSNLPLSITETENSKNLTTEVENFKENSQTASIINHPDILISNRNIGNFRNIDYCQECGEKFDSELKLSVHILQAHTIPKVHVIPKNNFQDKKNNLIDIKNENEATATNTGTSPLSNSKNGLDITPVRIKLENSDSDSDSENVNNNGNNNKLKQMSPIDSHINNNNNNSSNNNNSNMNGNPNLPPSRPDEWLSSISSLGFPFPPEAAAAFSASNYLSQLPLLGVPPVGTFNPVEGLSRPPLRIFNPEAYCDLCNKEFCNKYFLKTHKANKHGIYDPVTSSSDSTGTASNQFNQISQVLQMQFHQQQQQQHQQYEHHKQLQQQQQTPPSPIDISAQQQISQLQQQSQQHSSQHHSQSQKQQQSSTSTASQPTPQSLMPPEITVFCDICNKRFTNIFAMKRHRSKAHEIPRQTVSPISATTLTSNNNSNNNINNNTTSPNSSSNLMKLDTTGNKQNTTSIVQPQSLSILQQNEQLQHHEQQQNPNSSNSNTSNTSSSGNSEKDISSSSNNLSTQQQNQQQLLRIPEGFKEDYTLEQEEVSFTPQPRKLSPSSVQQAREANFSFDKLKRLGVINPEAFCDLCCKEYCNKYFLRTHKLKRHGIFIPMDDLIPTSTNPITGNSIGSNTNLKENEKNSIPVWPPFVQQMQQQMQQIQMQMHQATPLNLMMAAAAAGVPPNVTEKSQRRPSEDSDDDMNTGLSETNSFKKIRLDNILTRADDEKRPVSSSRNLLEPDEKTDKRNEKELISNVGENAKNIEIPDNLTQLMQEGLVNAAAAAAFASTHDPDAVGLDLQKLQSMILQLNDLNGQKPTVCNLCGKEMENQFHLQAHLATEHIGNLSNSSEDNNVLRSQIEAGLLPFKSHFGIPSQQSSPTNSNSPEICKQCDREFPGLMELKQHIIEYHGLMLSSPIREGFITPERSIPGGGSLTAPSTPNQMDRKPLYTVTPTSSYCEICNKELCNKYFMKTHMQRMHGIEIENGAQIGGVVCNICNKELCSKYFLRVHKTNSHGIVDEGSPIPGPIPGKFDETTKNLFDAFDSKSGDLSDLGARYFTHYTEVCPLCNRRFRSSKWLRAHLMSDHGKIGVEKLQELAQSMIFSKPGSPSPTQLKIPNGNGGRPDGGNGNITPSGSNVNNLIMGGLNNLDPAFLAKASPFPNLFMKSNNPNDEQSTSPSSTNQQSRFQEYQCSICPFTTPYYAFLFIHERSHSILNSSSVEQNNSGDGDRDREISRNISTATAIGTDIEEQLRNEENIKIPEIDQTEITLSKSSELSPKPEKRIKTPTKTISDENENLKKDIVMTENDNSIKKSNEIKNTRSDLKTDREEQKSKSPMKSPSHQQTTLTNEMSVELSENKSEILEETSLQQKQEKSHLQLQESEQPLLESKLDITTSIGTKTSSINSTAGLTTCGIPNFNTLTHLANLLNRPASYAIPQNFTTSDGELMQSFLIEEKKLQSTTTTSSSSTTAASSSSTTTAAASSSSSSSKLSVSSSALQGDEVKNNEDIVTDGKDNDEKNVNRFVPAVIFLPVRERISNPITVSFTLTPA
ncbi:uncharacterized protein LOC129609160 [Condylostylus longicornis]|uniref:uncharacterized protein LOC129609160 n=1 Tax=Condylostylus longicornis TaxID=2530218 RepID=UPI00244E080D|nr:uncharacterized protein LOC129609160 [Condylostylus longicornis]